MKARPLLKLESKIDRITFYLGNFLLITFLIYFLTVYKQNPILFSVLIIPIVFVISISTYKQIKVFSNKIEIVYKRFFIINNSVKTFYFDDISSIETNFKISGVSGILIQLIGFFRVSVGLVSSNYFILILKNNRRKAISTEILREDLIKVFQLIEKLSENRIKVTGLNQEIPLL